MTVSRGTGTFERRRRVLVADDDAGARHLLRLVLESAGYAVAEVHDGQELHDVLAMSPVGHFSVVIADHLMPRKRGLEVLASMSSRARFILLTAASIPAVEQAAERFGAAAFVRKPIDLIALVRIVREVMAREKETIGMLRASGE